MYGECAGMKRNAKQVVAGVVCVNVCGRCGVCVGWEGKVWWGVVVVCEVWRWKAQACAEYARKTCVVRSKRMCACVQRGR